MEHMNPVMVDYRLRHTQTTAENVEDFVGGTFLEVGRYFFNVIL